jgi:hypothetical protein
MSLFGRVYARCYDRFMGRIDRAGAAEHRRRLVEETGGRYWRSARGRARTFPFTGLPSGWSHSSPTPRCGL